MDGVIVDSEPLHEQSFLEVWMSWDTGTTTESIYPTFTVALIASCEAFIEKHNPTPAIEKLIGLREERLIRMLREFLDIHTETPL